MTAVYHFNPQQQRWEAYFPGFEGTTRVNDFDRFRVNEVYFIAINVTPTVTWVVAAP